MRSTYRLVMSLFACSLALLIIGQHAAAQTRKDKLSASALSTDDFGRDFLAPSKLKSRPRAARRLSGAEALLYDAITDRLGTPYLLGGTDERGYDCSGFVWRVFQDAGFEFERTSARILWTRLPQASEDETTQFGTLVFFEGLGHVGIVRDAHSFYHASSSQGVVRSFYTSHSGYWGKRVLGYRRVLLLEASEVER